MVPGMKSRMWCILLLGVVAGMLFFVAGCSKDASPTNPALSADKETDAHIIDVVKIRLGHFYVAPNIDHAPWRLHGIKRWQNYTFNGVGPEDFDLNCGEWWIEWLDVPDYITPENSGESTLYFLKIDTEHTFYGEYIYTGGEDPENMIGMYTDPICTANSLTSFAGIVPTYIVISGLTQPSISGWEVKITNELPGGEFMPTILGVNLFGVGPINAASIPGEYVVGLAAPLLPTDGMVAVAQFNLYYPNLFDVDRWYMSPVEQASIDDVPCYADGENSAILIPMMVSSLDYAVPVFTVNVEE